MVLLFFVKDSHSAFAKTLPQSSLCSMLRNHYGPWSARLGPQVTCDLLYLTPSSVCTPLVEGVRVAAVKHWRLVKRLPDDKKEKEIRDFPLLTGCRCRSPNSLRLFLRRMFPVSSVSAKRSASGRSVMHVRASCTCVCAFFYYYFYRSHLVLWDWR